MRENRDLENAQRLVEHTIRGFTDSVNAADFTALREHCTVELHRRIGFFVRLLIRARRWLRRAPITVEHLRVSEIYSDERVGGCVAWVECTSRYGAHRRHERFRCLLRDGHWLVDGKQS